MCFQTNPSTVCELCHILRDIQPIYANMMCGLLQKQEMELHVFFLGEKMTKKHGLAWGFLANGSSFQQKPPFQYWARCKNRIWLVV